MTKTYPKKDSFVENLAAAGERGLFSAIHMQSAMWQSALQYQLEAVQFLKHRLEEDLKSAKQFAECCSFAELQDQSSEFFEKAVDEYSEEMAKLSAMSTEMATNTARQMQDAAADTVIH